MIQRIASVLQTIRSDIEDDRTWRYKAPQGFRVGPEPHPMREEVADVRQGPALPLNAAQPERTQ